MLGWQERSGRAGAAVTGRDGGVSGGPYASLNLALHVGDDEQAVLENRRRVAGALGVEHLIFADQVHGREVVEATGPWTGPPPAADALVTATPGLGIGMLVADCTPVMLLAGDEGVVGVAHAGRQGMASGVVLALVAAMRDLGARRLRGVVGPSICPRCYEVPLALREQVAAVAPVARSVSRAGTPALDVAGAVLEQLAPHCASLVQLPGCSRERADLYSYRRAARTGRYAGIAWLPA